MELATAGAKLAGILGSGKNRGILRGAAMNDKNKWCMNCKHSKYRYATTLDMIYDCKSKKRRNQGIFSTVSFNNSCDLFKAKGTASTIIQK
jgi:hypothetical protein